VLDDYLTKNPEIVRRFVAASLKGWDDTFAKPDEAAGILVKLNPTVNQEIARAVIDVTKDIVVVPETRDKGIGYMDPATVKETVENITKAFDVKDPPAPEQIYTNDLLPKR
jgi:NitT/TauT family transport system substrate-binding protein